MLIRGLEARRRDQRIPTSRVLATRKEYINMEVHLRDTLFSSRNGYEAPGATVIYIGYANPAAGVASGAAGRQTAMHAQASPRAPMIDVTSAHSWAPPAHKSRWGGIIGLFSSGGEFAEPADVRFRVRGLPAAKAALLTDTLRVKAADEHQWLVTEDCQQPF
ncbi:hypothetical protein NDU88_000996 [Pleurodeles waltl]|uniref:Uncharacterized protein n=1 Tax=Pleurodeles waltl TaxID=8319 RepID=A0AAV7NCZ4_PLEWA|nr:hypothetical protein NDU88_000996 [Pleurodeles waltl]